MFGDNYVNVFSQGFFLSFTWDFSVTYLTSKACANVCNTTVLQPKPFCTAVLLNYDKNIANWHELQIFCTVISFLRALGVFSITSTNKPIFFKYSWCWKSTLDCSAQICLPLGPKWLGLSRRTGSNKVKGRSGYKNSIQSTAGEGFELNGYKDWIAGEKQNHSSGQQALFRVPC